MADVTDFSMGQAKVGQTADELDQIVIKKIVEQDCYPSGIGYMGFPKASCISVNETVAHGIPNDRPFEDGDWVSLDITLYKDGFFGDNCVTFHVGKEPHPEVLRLIKESQEILYDAIRICGPGVPFSEIGEVIEKSTFRRGFEVCEVFFGHGIGPKMHMSPLVYHMENDAEFGLMQKGNVFTIEPIILMRRSHYHQWDDGFTVTSHDNPSSQWEHMILITDDGCEVLTQRNGETIFNDHRDTRKPLSL